MAPSTGLNQCSALPFLCGLVFARSAFLRKEKRRAMVFWRNILCDCAQSFLNVRCKHDMWFVCYDFEGPRFGTARAPFLLSID